ncbi:all trans-polyprenyl-diphosphate synthase PDSS2-like [Ptychodera flava]|uniref:all trans-polyprenyl-diphosphate synthase PDSS2-like n=1 Tax=Ptychodera flava TaxID=63121 RepID=UPI00396A5B9C
MNTEFIDMSSRHKLSLLNRCCPYFGGRALAASLLCLNGERLTAVCRRPVHVAASIQSHSFQRLVARPQQNSFSALHRETYTATSLLNHIVNRPISFFGFGSSEQNAWQKAVSEAEKLVGYPTSFMSLRCLLSDELSNVAIQVRKLVGTRHPLLKTARTFVYDGRNTMQTRGLIVLLISKAAGPTTVTTSEDGVQPSIVSGIYASQRALAEITEMIHTAYLVHKGVVNLRDLTPADGPEKDMEFGNKMAVLSGDFLLANASTGLAQLQNTKVVEIVSSAIRDMMEAEFTSYSTNLKDSLDRKLDLSDWHEWAFLSSSSLIAKSCQAALNLAKHSPEMQQHAYDYGKHMSLAQQLHTELTQFTNGSPSATTSLNLNSVPVLLFLQSKERSEVTEKYTKNGKVDMKKLHADVLYSDAVDKAKQLCHEYGQKALDAIKPFPVNDARNALQNIIHAIAVR